MNRFRMFNVLFRVFSFAMEISSSRSITSNLRLIKLHYLMDLCESAQGESYRSTAQIIQGETFVKLFWKQLKSDHQPC